MKVNYTRNLVLFIALNLALATFVSAGVAPIATLNGDANVTVNGKPVKVAQPAFAGDTIEAPGSSLGIIHFPEQGMASLSAAARASLEQSGKEVWLGLQRGYVGVREGAQPISVRAHGGKISADAGSVFEVAQVKDATYVTVIKGSATISEGGLDEPQAIAQGQSYKVAFLEPGPLGPMPAPRGQAAGGTDTTCKDLKASCSKDATTCKTYEKRCPVCNDPCKAGSGTQACTDFKATEAKCTPMRKACAKDNTKCNDYATTCAALAGCKGYGGILEASSGAAGAGSAAAAASTAAAAGAASTTAITAAVAAAAAGAGVAGAAAAGALGGSSCTTTASTTCP
jgi:hypothetical protein